MQLFDSTSSPFVRKVNIVIRELGLEARIERLAQDAHPVRRDAHLMRFNPLGQVPTLVLDDGCVLCDSRVICEYLDQLGEGRIFPREGPARWGALAWQSLADGLLDAAILMRYEANARPPQYRWEGWEAAQWAKVESVLQSLARAAPSLGDRLNIGTLSIACALGYLDFRFPERAWRPQRSALADWFGRMSMHPSIEATLPRPRT
ncbi:putative GST-like protein YibF [Variovorax sp. PBS-H4]|uniref:glutathione S-transferase n=1 Tax=Variovorax sp. PBS-H4 TaxID=434008 RepID=UPI001316D617|nr:glutathione S-transferase [Variovorax sp. PBS-H4]VTU31754.1 putative GST-like protein YibF [Variovorax sp. PBS-H4]